jgi:hypothetical protein
MQGIDWTEVLKAVLAAAVLAAVPFVVGGLRAWTEHIKDVRLRALAEVVVGWVERMAEQAASRGLPMTSQQKLDQGLALLNEQGARASEVKLKGAIEGAVNKLKSDQDALAIAAAVCLGGGEG